MKILHMTGMPSSKYGSVERFFVEQMKANPEDEFFLQYDYEPCAGQYIADIHKYRGGYRVFNTAGLQFVKHIFAYIKLLREYKPDVVHFHFGFNFPLYAPIARIMGIKAIMQTEHLCLTYGPDRKQVTKKSELRPIYRVVFLWGLALKPFDKVICVGNHVRRQFETIFDNYKHYETIYMGVQEARNYGDSEKQALREELNIPDGTQVITTTAFAVWLKGGDVFVNALQHLKDSNYVALIIGFDESIAFTQELHQLAKTLGVEDKIRWIGITNEVYKFLSISDIYVQPSRTEALGLAVCEALSYGLPCVGSNAGGLPEVCNVLFETANSRDLAEKLDTLMADPALRSKLGAESRKAFEEKFDFRCGVAAYHKLYEETLAKKAKHKK